MSVRPSAAELLSSDSLPRPPLEEAQFVESLKRALAQTGSANYHKLIGSLFDRSQSLAQDQCWDLDLQQVSTWSLKIVSLKALLVYQLPLWNVFFRILEQSVVFVFLQRGIGAFTRGIRRRFSSRGYFWQTRGSEYQDPLAAA